MKIHAENQDCVSGSVRKMVCKQNGLFFTVDYDALLEVFAVLLFNVDKVAKRLQRVSGRGGRLDSHARYESKAKATLK